MGRQRWRRRVDELAAVVYIVADETELERADVVGVAVVVVDNIGHGSE
jgi:hypothetical protein